jgi:hypothetical protein
MKPHEMYSGAAPAAIGQMGQGLLEGGANIGKLNYQGLADAGKSIASGVQAVGDAYKEYKSMTADVAAKEKAIGLFLPYLPEDKRAPFEKQIANVQTDPNMSLAKKKAFYDTAFGMLGQSVGHQMTMEKVAAENTAALARAKVGATAAVTTAAMPYTHGPKGEALDTSMLLPGDNAKPQATTGTPLIPSMEDRILRVQAYQQYYNQNPNATGEDYQQFEDNYLKANRKPR